MTIIGIEGGIGTGKTLTGVSLVIRDLLKGRKVFSNTKFKNVRGYENNIIYLTKDMLKQIFDHVKEGKFDMKNSSVFIQEAHNYIDSRNSMTTQNKLISYWILQSRHTGEGSCDIIYDTQDFGQIDKRLRLNTDFFIHPYIIEWEEYGGKRKPSKILIKWQGKIGHKWREFREILDVSKTRDMYNTHELVDF